jgi:hypothetical protein
LGGCSVCGCHKLFSCIGACRGQGKGRCAHPQPEIRSAGYDHLHCLLSKAHLRLEKGEVSGYTVLAIGSNIRVKASDVFRNNFAGKINRRATEIALGAWTPASASGYEDVQQAVHTPVRNGALREEPKAQRHQGRDAL